MPAEAGVRGVAGEGAAEAQPTRPVEVRFGPVEERGPAEVAAASTHSVPPS